jgi:hypothetical protein
MFLFHKQLYPHIHILYLSFIVCVIGIYLSFVNPRKFALYFEGTKYTYTGIEKFILVDMLFHICVFWYIYANYNKYYIKNQRQSMYINAWLIMLIYIAFIRARKVYGIPFLEICIVFILANILYFMFYYSK